MHRDIPIKFFITLGMILCGLVPLLFLGITAHTQYVAFSEERIFYHLEAVRNMKKAEIEEILNKRDKKFNKNDVQYVTSERSGLGKTGEIYIVGQDYRMKTDSYLDPVKHSANASKEGNIELNGAKTEPVERALAGETGSIVSKDYRGIKVLSAFTPITVENKTWALIVEMDEKEMRKFVSQSVPPTISITILIAFLLLCFLAFIISRIISNNIKYVVKEIDRLINDFLNGNLEARGDALKSGADLREIIVSMNRLIDAFAKETKEKAKLQESINYNQRLESIGTMAGGIAHDFNNILAYMFAYADIIKMQEGLNNVSIEALNGMTKGMERAGDLIAQIMTFSRHNKQERKPIKPSIIIKETLKMMKNVFPKNITIKNNISDSDIYINADPTEIHQIILNLCTNAFHAMQENGGNIDVSLFSEKIEYKLYAAILVKDSGCGIKESDIPHIFEPFFTTKPQGQGSGMGLAVIHGIIKNLAGEITVNSVVNKGTEVKIIIPQIEKPLFIEKNNEQNKIVSGNGKILLIDDEPEILYSLSTLINSMGYDSEVTSSVEKALIFIKNSKFDLIITDYNMPEMNGITFAKKIKEIAPAIPIILMTGYSEKVNQTSDTDSIFSKTIIKPVPAHKLSEIIYSLITKSDQSN